MLGIFRVRDRRIRETAAGRPESSTALLPEGPMLDEGEDHSDGFLVLAGEGSLTKSLACRFRSAMPG